MKELKFRQPIFQKYGGFIRWHFWGFIEGEFISPVNIAEGGKDSQQFTGLIDVKGNNIYEGDIISQHNRIYEVAINFNGFYAQRYKLWRGKFKPASQYCLSLFTKPNGKVDGAEIVGNIHQNPEMLEALQMRP